MTDILTTTQRNQLIKTMNMLRKMCPSHLAPYYCNEKCPYINKDVCPSEISIKIQNFMDSTLDVGILLLQW